MVLRDGSNGGESMLWGVCRGRVNERKSGGWWYGGVGLHARDGEQKMMTA